MSVTVHESRARARKAAAIADWLEAYGQPYACGPGDLARAVPLFSPEVRISVAVQAGQRVASEETWVLVERLLRNREARRGCGPVDPFEGFPRSAS